MDLPSQTTWESDIFRLSTFDFHHFFEFLDFPFSTFGFFFLSPVCPLMKPPRNRTTISPTDSDSKQPRSFLRINTVQASLPKAQLVSFKLALKTRFARLRCVFSVCELNNYEPNCDQCNNKPTKTRQDRSNHNYTDDRPHDPASATKTTRSPTKSAIQALEGITASLPSSLHPLALHFGNKLISIRSKRITKENIAKRMAKEANYIPKSAKATDFKITLSKGASEDNERVSFLEQQIQQAKDTYESSLKNVIEECISLETSALQSQENETIYTLLASIAEAINTLEGLKTDVHQKVISLIYLDCSFISYTTSTSRDSFISSYCTHHNLENIPTPTIHPLSITHASANERDTELLLHTKSLQRHENNGLQTFRKAIEGIIIAPSVSYEKQIEENNRDIVLKKLSNDIILGKATESTAMELDAEGGASFEQLQELIKKECDKRDKHYRSLENKYNKLQESLQQSQQKNSSPRGQGGASNKKKTSPSTARKAQPQRGRSALKPRPKQQGSRQPQHQKGKADDTTNVVSNEHGRSSMRRRRSRSQLKKKISSTDRNKQRLQSATS